MFNNKLSALSYFLNVPEQNIGSKFMLKYGKEDDYYLYGEERYFVLTDDEADKLYRLKFPWMLHKLKTETIMRYLDLDECSDLYAIVSTIQSFGAQSNRILKKLIGDNYGRLLVDYLFMDNNSRGTCISDFDGLEHQLGRYFAYRLR